MQPPTDLHAERRRRATRPNPERRAMRSFDARLSAMIDRATVELENAGPEEVAAWRRVLRELERAAGL